MKPLPSSARVLCLGLSLFLTAVLAACGGAGTSADTTTPPTATKTPVMRCAP
jgi:hypothetical protein